MIGELVANVFHDLDGVGLDLVDVTLMRDLLAEGGPEFIDAYWTATEQADSGNDPERLAGRWAAKEAVMKCLRVGVGDVDPIDIEVLSLASGAPRAVLRGRAAQIAAELNVEEWYVAITHDGGWAAALAVSRRQKDLSLSPSSEEPPTEGDANV
jgi:holo-[acyl-carrier protein] synthase